MSENKGVQYRWVVGKEEGFAGCSAVRYRVFVEEQGFSQEDEWDGLDAGCLHLLGEKDGQPVATARFYEEKPGQWHVGRVAVLQKERGYGIGLAMMQKLTEKARALGGHRILLNAQADKYAFYEKVGFVKTGIELLDGGQPHVEMVLELAPAEAVTAPAP